MHTLLQDLRFGLRQLRRAPGFALTAVLTLALGIGANTAVFSLLDQALLRSLPVRDPGQLVLLKGTGSVWEGHTSSHGSVGAAASFSYPIYRELRDRDRAFNGVIATAPVQIDVQTKGTAREVAGEIVSGNYFTVLGVMPALGQLFTQAQDVQPDAAPVAVLGYDFWRNGMNSNPAIVGSTISLNGHPFQVLGVAAPEFRSAAWGESPAVFVPMTMLDQIVPGAGKRLTDHTDRWLNILGRLGPGITAAQAQAASLPLWHALRAEELKALGTRSPRFMQDFLDRSQLLVEPAARGLSYDRKMYTTPLLVMMGMAGLVLLIAVVNIGSLLLVRAAGRVHEFTMRRALGASGERLTVQLLTEGLLIGLLGGALGLLLAPLAMRLIVAQLATQGDSPFRTDLDGRVLLFTFAVAVLLSVLVSLVPLLQLRRRDLTLAVRQAGPTATGGLLLLRRSVVGVQIGLSLLLLVSAGLLVQTLERLRAQNVGFRTDHLLVFDMSPRLAGYESARVPQLEEQLVRALAAVPGATATGITNNPELAGNDHGTNITLEHYTPALEEEVNPQRANVTPAFFSTMQMPLRAGRAFTPDDDAHHPPVAVVNHSFAVRYFGSDAEALGQRLAEGGPAHPVFDTEIVGVVGDVRHLSLRSLPEPALFRPASQASKGDLNRTLYIYVRGQLPPRTLFEPITKAVAGIDANLAINSLTTMHDQVESNLQSERSMALLAIVFGGLAALLAGVGLYGVLAFVVAQRTREIGVRMALGATRVHISQMVLADVSKMLASGLLLGVLLSYLLGRTLQSQLFGVSPSDPVSLLLAIACLAAVALMAAMIPARRAASVNPTEALRTE